MIPKNKQELELWYKLMDLYEIKKKKDAFTKPFPPFSSEFDEEYKQAEYEYFEEINELNKQKA